MLSGDDFLNSLLSSFDTPQARNTSDNQNVQSQSLNFDSVFGQAGGKGGFGYQDNHLLGLSAKDNASNVGFSNNHGGFGSSGGFS